MHPTYRSAHLLVRLLTAFLLAALLMPFARLSFAATSPIVIEAEHPDENRARNGYSWQLASALTGFGGHGYMQATPTAYHFFHSDETTSSPELRYDVQLPEDGLYYLWVRSNNNSRDGNSLYFGLDDSMIAGVSTSYNGQWSWSQYTVDGGRAQIKARAGNHILSVWVREAGQQLDRMLLTTDRDYVPTGVGPDAPGDHGQTATPATTTSTPGGHEGHATPTPATTTTPTTPPSAPTGHPAGCKAGEIFVDAQDWWMPGAGQRGNDFGHVHTSLCFPLNKTVSGKMTLTVVSKLHHNPGQFYGLNVSTSKTVSDKRRTCNDAGALNCWRDRANPRTLARCAQTGGTPLDGGETCAWSDTITFDTRDFGSDGWKQIRVRAFVLQPDGREQRTSTGLQIFAKNGLPRHDYSGQVNGTDWVEGRGWYGGDVNYTNAAVRNPPTGPVSGVWQPEVRLDRGADGIAATGWYAAIDTDFHHGKQGAALCPAGVQGAGSTIACGTGAFRGRLRIDTTTLSNGWHRLFLKGDARAHDLDSTNSGVLAIWFEVKN